MKNCLGKEILFEFYNKTLDESQMQDVRIHLDECEQCKKNYNSLSKDIELVKGHLDIINPKLNRIPEFNANKLTAKHKANYTNILSWAAGICLFAAISGLITIKFTQHQKPVNEYEYLDYIPDMNDAWNNQTIIVTSYDKKGNPVNHEEIGD